MAAIKSLAPLVISRASSDLMALVRVLVMRNERLSAAGKSNLMDAISFVLGVRTGHLRSANLKELLHRSSANSMNTAVDTDDEEGVQQARHASVSLLYRKDDGSELVLRRAFVFSLIIFRT